MTTASKKSTLPELLMVAAQTAPDATAVWLDGETRSFKELWDDVVRRADAFIGLGCAPADKIGILLPNSIDYIELLFGAMLAGCVPVTINNRYKTAELAYVLKQADVKVLFTSAAAETDYLSAVGVALPSLNPKQTGQSCPESPVLKHLFVLEAPPAQEMSNDVFMAHASGRKIADMPPIASDDLAFMMFTSGTTANPKACCMPHRSIVGNAFAQVKNWKMDHNDRTYDPLPFFHVSTILPLAACLISKSAFYATRYFRADEAVRTLEDEAITVGFMTFPTLTNEIIAHPDFDGNKLTALRLVNNVAPYTSLKHYDEVFVHSVGVSVFGMTEAGGVISFGNVDDPLEKRLTTIGRPCDGIEVRITDPEEPSKVLPAGEKGEIQIRGYCLFKGYYNDAEATRNAMAEGGWYRSGDLGTLDADGYVSFGGRWKDMLKVGGENVAALEIEGQINSHPAVVMSQIVGVPDDRLDEVAAAFVELQEGAEMTAQEVIDHCKGQSSNFKIPRYVVFVTEWPMSATKVQKFRLKDLPVGEKYEI